MAREYRTSLQFPAKPDEQIIIRDGRGRTVETWTVIGRQDAKTASYITFAQDGYRSAGKL